MSEASDAVSGLSETANEAGSEISQSLSEAFDSASEAEGALQIASEAVDVLASDVVDASAIIETALTEGLGGC